MKTIIKLSILFTLSAFLFVSCGDKKKSETKEAQTEQMDAESHEGHDHDHDAHAEEMHSDTTMTETASGEAMEVKYACPMKCEKDKTYAEEGKCPKCKMDLEKVES